MSEKYKFKILREEVEAKDFYEEQTHEKIKKSLFNLIQNEDEGITIGLSGPWGSGKSTIINLLKKEGDFLFFYFDAWAHEGDPLRRIFLESFINCCKEEESNEDILNKLEEKRAIISREKRIKKTEIKRSTTKLGLFLAVSTFILSIGLAFLSSINYENLTSTYTGSINLAFYTGVLFSLTPFFVLLINYCHLKKNKKDVRDLNYWAFVQNNSNETVIEDVSSDEERSSIEFERYFKEILEINNSIKKRKIIIVLDNLDRVDAEVSLKIWSTLQTFIQHKNPASKDYEIFKFIFTVIPYDEESLMKIWESYKKDEESIDNNFAKSFFDKSFQVRIDVPKPIVSNWLDFIDKMIEKAFEVWPEEEKRVIKEVIEKTRKNVLDNPKPREIKTYLNQVGFLRNHFLEDISTKNIAFYCFKRYLQGKSNEQISDYLLQVEKIPVEEINLIEDDTIQEISAIVYGVAKDKGLQLLLSPKIMNALNLNKPHELKELAINHKNVFWSIFKKIISDTSDFQKYLEYSTPINISFEEINKDVEANFISLLVRYLDAIKQAD
ncbi:P-loop NTPase fold protein [Flavobacterium sp. 245]|uniref:P-loop NTPase fold protein n=1 Tax=Flavobacterium sp. 245 TaxID=2512115 RepID=UPI0010602536|nr:P-loop NTPase fold protein [Flavobacterium sp. 245]TDO94958.1 KAP-like P-loop domain-containing protein [Flavobacterium sp. 245]